MGNAIQDLGPNAFAGQLPVPCTEPGESTFLTEPNELTDGWTELDQYFIGVRKDVDVSSFWYVDEPRSAFNGASLDSGNPQTGLSAFSAQDDIIFCGKRVDLTVADIQAFGNNTVAFNFPPNGHRVPEIGDEVDAMVDGEPVDVKTMAFILLFEDESAIRKSTVGQVQTFLETWEEYANGPATGGLGKFDTSLDPAIH